MNIFDYWDDYEEVPGGATPRPIVDNSIGPEMGSIFNMNQRAPRDPGNMMTYGIQPQAFDNVPPLAINYDMSQRGARDPSNPATYGVTADLGKGPPTLPELLGGGSDLDVSGFANYGMQAPQLEGPMKQLGGLMAINERANQPQQRQQMPQGGLMAYLLSLGAN